MARYDYESTQQYAEQKFAEAKKYNEEQAKKQEKFSKKLLMFDTAVKGANTLINQRANTLKNSLAEERAYLASAQSNAKKILNQNNDLINKNMSQRQWIESQMLERYRSQLETNVDGLMVQTMKNGKTLEVPLYDIPTSTLSKTKLIIDEKEISFGELVDNNLEQWKSLVTQAQSVPSNVKDLDAYVDQYVDKEMPSNLFDWMTRPLRKASKSETSQTLQEKLKRSSDEILSNPMFANFTNFDKSLKNSNANFENQIVDLVNDFQNDMEKDPAGNTVDKKFNKIVSDVAVSYQKDTVETVNPETNKINVTLRITPKIAATYADNSMSTRDGKAVTEITGDKLLVTLNSALLDTYENILSEQGMNEFNKHEDMIKNPVKAFNDVVKMGINEKGPNLYLKGDIDVGAAIEKLMQSPDIKELIGVGVPQTKEEYLRLNPDKNFQDYQAYLKGHQVGVSNVIKETLNTIVIGLRKTGQ